jgi:hypothetical protein
MNCKQTFLRLLKKYDTKIDKMSIEDDKILDDTFLDCMRKNINPFTVMREAREEYEKIQKTNL